MSDLRRRYALLGTGSRARMYIDAMSGEHSDVAQLVALSDTNEGRIGIYERFLAERGVPAPIRFAPGELGEVVRRERIDRVIVTTPDFSHADYVVAALEAGAD